MFYCICIVCFLQDSLIANLLRLIQKMKPIPKVKEKENIIAEQQSDIEIKKKLFPGLALPNDPSVRTSMVTPVSTTYAENFMSVLFS